MNSTFSSILSDKNHRSPTAVLFYDILLLLYHMAWEILDKKVKSNWNAICSVKHTKQIFVNICTLARVYLVTVYFSDFLFFSFVCFTFYLFILLFSFFFLFYFTQANPVCFIVIAVWIVQINHARVQTCHTNICESLDVMLRCSNRIWLTEKSTSFRDQTCSHFTNSTWNEIDVERRRCNSLWEI